MDYKDKQYLGSKTEDLIQMINNYQRQCINIIEQSEESKNEEIEILNNKIQILNNQYLQREQQYKERIEELQYDCKRLEREINESKGLIRVEDVLEDSLELINSLLSYIESNALSIEKMKFDIDQFVKSIECKGIEITRFKKGQSINSRDKGNFNIEYTDDRKLDNTVKSNIKIGYSIKNGTSINPDVLIYKYKPA